ncbi:hypothetical protein GTG23_03660 [Rhodococcus hoagii]|nr:hypothetical protein [Prescottella equi]
MVRLDDLGGEVGLPALLSRRWLVATAGVAGRGLGLPNPKHFRRSPL